MEARYIFSTVRMRHGGYDTIAQGVIQNGTYVFTAPGCYGGTIEARPDNTGSQAMLPTYLGNTISGRRQIR